MKGLKIFFSDFFDVDEKVIEAYGAVNISLINDLPLFVDPFLLFNSDKNEYQEIHNNIIEYLLFLQKKAIQYPKPNNGMIRAWYHFPEVKQTWLGFSLDGNGGRGMGTKFANNLHMGLQSLFKDFGNETITQSPHLEKLCLIQPLVGRDKISDFTTNFTKKYILEYTVKFAKEYLYPSQCKDFKVDKVEFNFETETWKSKTYTLPFFNDDFVLLTPRDMLTRDNTFINRNDMIRNLQNIAPAIEDETLRFELNNYFTEILTIKNQNLRKQEKEKRAIELIERHPELIDYYIKHKEENENLATSISKKAVEEVEFLFNNQVEEFVKILKSETGFYQTPINTYDAAYDRVMYLKHAIEDLDCYRCFYVKGKPINSENTLQILYRLTWFATDFDVNREVNNGRGPVDFKISRGAKDCTLVEFKLASNTKLKKNLENQVEIYKKANDTEHAIKVIMYFTDAEFDKVNKILNELNLQNCKDIVLINAIDNKISASNVG